MKGEFVVAVEGAPPKLYDITLKEHVEMLMDEGLDKKAAVKKVAQERKVAKSIVYKEALGDKD